MSTEISVLHQAARDYALSGIPVFPCIEGGKAPAVENGFKDATTDLAQIDAWWTRNPNYNIAIEPARVGWCVIDLDPPVGEESWAELIAEHGSPPDTFEVRTPRGGRHIYFAGELGPTVSKLGKKIDTRGRGSYVLVPPSRVGEDGASYEVSRDVVVAPLPAWIDQAIRRDRERAKAAVEELDTASAVARVTSLLSNAAKRGDVAVEGEGGNDRTYKIATECLNLGVSEPVAIQLISDHWNLHCIPPWSVDELTTIVSNAASYAQNEPAAWGVPTAEEAFGSVLDTLDLKAPAVGRSRYYPYTEDEQDAMPEPTWLIPDMIPAEATVLMYGESGSYKSFLALDLALTVASGTDKHGYTGKPQDVVYAAAEGPRSISRKRRPAWRLAHSIQGPMKFSLINDVPFVSRAETIQEFCEAIEARDLKPRLVVIDTLARSMAGMNENDAKDAGEFIEAIEAIKRKFACTVVVVHHSGKESERGARGSSAFYAGFDCVLEVKAHKVTKAVSIYCRKQKDADERMAPWTFEGKPVATSLVFFETDAVAHGTLTASDDVFEPRKVGAALAKLKAFGVEHGVTTSVLAASMFPAKPDDSPEDHQENTHRYATQLRAHSKIKLEMYVEKHGRELLWFLPPMSADATPEPSQPQSPTQSETEW